MANKYSVDLSINTKGYKDGMDAAKKENEQFSSTVVDANKDLASLNKTLGAAKREVNNLALAYAQLTKEEKQTASGQALKRQLEQAKEYAAELIDLKGDLNEELKHMASDTAMWDMGKEGINVTKDALTALATTIEDVTGKETGLGDMIKAVAKIQTVANAAITIGNALQKNSALMRGIATLQAKLHTAAIRTETTTTKANTVATAANTKAVVTETGAKVAETTATTGATIAQKAFNAVAKANPYVLLATSVLAVGGALLGFIGLTDKTTDEQEKLNKELEEAKEKAEAYKKELDDLYANTATKLLTTYTKLQTAWNRLNTEAEKKNFIKEYADEMKNLGVAVNSVREAENLFVANSQAFVKSIMLRARAAVLQRELEQQIEAAIRQHEADAASDRPNQPQGEYNLWDMLSQRTAQKIADINAEIEELMRNYGFNTNTSGGNAGSGTTQQVEEIKSYLDKLKEARTKAQKMLEFVPEGSAIETMIKSFIYEIEQKIKEEEKRLKIELPVVPEIDLTEIYKIKDKALSDKQEPLYNFSSLPEEFEKPANDLLDKFNQLEEGKKELDKIINGKNSKPEQILAALEATKELNEEQNKLREGLNVYQELNDQTVNLAKHYEKLAEKLSYVGECIGDLGSILGSIHNLIGDEDKFFNVSAIIAQAVATYMLGWTKAVADASSLGFIGWLGFTLSTASQVMAMVSQIKSAVSGYAEGGIIGSGTSMHDNTYARVAEGEMILNRHQQRNLFDAIDNNKLGGSQHVQVTGVIRGTDLLLVEKNTKTVLSKSGKNITF